MRDPMFDTLRSELLESGVAPRHIRRLVSELSDHVEDLRLEALSDGKSEPEAYEFATARIGDQKLIAECMRENIEFRTWIYRYPRIALVYLPVAWALMLPAAPVFAGFANPAIVFRWGAALMLSAGVTAGMLLCMQLAIILT